MQSFVNLATKAIVLTQTTMEIVQIGYLNRANKYFGHRFEITY